MSKLAHSNQGTMDELDHQRAIGDGNEDLLGFPEATMLDAARKAVMKYPYFTDGEALGIARAVVAAALSRS